MISNCQHLLAQQAPKVIICFFLQHDNLILKRQMQVVCQQGGTYM